MRGGEDSGSATPIVSKLSIAPWITVTEVVVSIV
jgi:hypothetical protein